MPHETNRKAFLSAAQCASPLASAYCSLVAIELCLKDTAPTWPPIAHDVPQMLTDLGDAGLVALAGRLRIDLSSLNCTIRNGLSAPVNPRVYPDLRYARVDADFPDGSPISAFETLKTTVADIITALDSKGVAP